MFGAVQTTAETKAAAVQKCRHLAESHLPLLKIKLDASLALCEQILSRDADPEAVNIINQNHTHTHSKPHDTVAFPGRTAER